MRDLFDEAGITPEAAPTGGGPRDLFAEAGVSVPAAVKAGKELNSIPRQLGLTARYGLEGLANTAQVVTEPIRYLQDRVTGMPSKPLGAVASQFADWLGMPKPETANERVIGDASRLVAGAGGLGAAASTARAIPGLVGQGAGLLSANMGQQLSSAAGAGLAGGASREAGGSPLMQAGASLVGGVAGGLVPGAIDAVTRPVINAVRSATTSPGALDVQIQAVLQRSGVDYSQLPAAAQTALRSDMAQALQAGQELNPDAVRRLADFRVVGATPTRGMVTQNPVQITREQNLAKIGANAGDDALHGLPLIQNQNNATLIRNLDNAGAAGADQFRAGQASLGGILSENARLQGAKNAAYGALEQMPGYRAPIAPNGLSSINQALGDEAAMPFMPQKISNYMESFLQPNGPAFTPQGYNNLQKMLTGASTSQDGNERNAVRVAMRALEGAPITPANGSASAADAQQAISQLQAARAAHSDWRTWQESARPIEAALGGAQPDKFVQQFVVNGSVADARAVAQYAPAQEVRGAILDHLKDKALNDASSEVGKFSQSAYNKALEAIGDRKLSLYFSPEELGALRANGRVASYMQNQPVGSAVNNSNSGALMLGKGLDALGGLAKSAPFVGPLVAAPVINGIQGLNIAVRNRQAANVLPGLLATPEKTPLMQGLLLPGMAAGGLLSAPQ